LLQGLEASLGDLAQRVVQASAGSAESGYRDVYVALRNKIREQYKTKYADASARMADVARFADALTTARAEEKYQREMAKAIGSPPPPPGLAWPEFISHPTVRRQFSEQFKRVHPVDPDCAITLAWDQQTYSRCAYEYAVKLKATGVEQSLRKEAVAYADGGTLQAEGRAAYKAVVVPALALCLSLFFGLLNILLLFGELVAAPLRRLGLARAARPLAATAVLALLVGPWFISNPLTDAAEYKRLFKSAREAAEGPAAVVPVALDWALRAEPAAYPIMSEIHRTLLGGWSFASPACR
jgi:hypothetical protein